MKESDRVMKKIVSCFSVILLTILLVSCKKSNIIKCNPIYAMNTIINVSFYGTEDTTKHYDEIKKIYQKYDSVSSDFESSKVQNVFELNEKRSIVASAELIELVNEAVAYIDKTNGYFNPFIGRISHIWKDAIEKEIEVDSKLIEKELEIMNSTSVKIENSTISLIGDGNLDLGGIAKGYATSKAVEYLEDNGITGYLISAGNSNISCGTKPDSIFKIALENSDGSDLYKIVEVNNASLGTSSYKYQNKIINGALYHHLINPFTGFPACEYDSVSVKGNTPTDCDVYSTAIFAMNKDDAIDFATKNHLEIILYKNNEIIYQSDWWKNNEYQKK